MRWRKLGERRERRENKAPHRVVFAYNEHATLGDPLLPTCTEQPEGSLSSVASLFLAPKNAPASHSGLLVVVTVSLVPPLATAPSRVRYTSMNSYYFYRPSVSAVILTVLGTMLGALVSYFALTNQFP
jgi:hypothetical protein